MSEHRYLHSDWKDEVEYERQRIQAGIYDPVTIRRLEATGISEGWKCLEAGAGIGSVAQWLSKRVGPTGRVVATDIELRFLGRISAPNLEIRQHDIMKDYLETGHYDLVHCRLLLMHLAEPEKALKRLADAVRSGGWLVIEDYDVGSQLTTDFTDPSFASFTALWRGFWDYCRKTGALDPYFGRRVRGLVEGLGFVDVGHDGWCRTFRGGDPGMKIYYDPNVFSNVFRPLIDAGLVTQEQLDDSLRLSLDPAFNMIGFIMFCAWGRKPAV
jgi:SAM-dependent methyltransferase